MKVEAFVYIRHFHYFQFQSTQLPSGVGVHSLDNGSAISSVAILVKAGSRHETSDNFGVNHAIRLAAGLTSGKATSFSACRSIQQVSYLPGSYLWHT